MYKPTLSDHRWTGAALAHARKGARGECDEPGMLQLLLDRGMEPPGEAGLMAGMGSWQGWGHSWVEQLQRWQRDQCEGKVWRELVHPCSLVRQIQVWWALGHYTPGTLIRPLSFFSTEFLFHCGWRSIKAKNAIYLFKKAVLTKTCSHY